MELSRHFFAEAKYENRNLLRHLPRQLPSAEANYEGCELAFFQLRTTKHLWIVWRDNTKLH